MIDDFCRFVCTLMISDCGNIRADWRFNSKNNQKCGKKCNNAAKTRPDSLSHFRRIGAIFSMYFYTTVNGSKSENGVSIYRMTALCQCEIYAFQVSVYYQNIVITFWCNLIRRFKLEVLSTLRSFWSIQVEVMVAYIYIRLYYIINVELLICNAFIKFRDFFETEFLYQMSHNRFVYHHFPILEPTLKQFLGIKSIFYLSLFQSCTYLRLCVRTFYHVQPFTFGLLRVRCCNFYGIATVQHLSERHAFAVYLASYASIVQFRVDMVREVENGRTFRKSEQVAFGWEYKHFILVKIQFELVHYL